MDLPRCRPPGLSGALPSLPALCCRTVDAIARRGVGGVLGSCIGACGILLLNCARAGELGMDTEVKAGCFLNSDGSGVFADQSHVHTSSSCSLALLVA